MSCCSDNSEGDDESMLLTDATISLLPRYQQYDVVVIGSGSAGLTAARGAAKWGARTLLVEKLMRCGGDCTWFGCVPSKALIRCARAASEVRKAARFGVMGIDSASVKIDWAGVQKHIRSCQEFIYKKDDSPEVLAEEGVEVLLGRSASFEDETTLQLIPEGGGKAESVTADRIIICTGAGPSIPPITGLNYVPFFTYETIFNAPTLPNRLIVVGGGPIGCELAQAFARLGSKVTLVGTMLPREDEDVRTVMKKAFSIDGIICADGRAQKVQRSASGVMLWTTAGQQIEGDTLLIASGRKPKGLEALNLEAAGIDYDPDEGITVDSAFRTSASHVYAVGDCLGGLQFTHLAGFQAGLAALNAAAFPFGYPGKPKPESCPRCTFTHPEVASVGLTAQQAKETYGDDACITVRQATDIDRAVCEGEPDGFIKVIHTRKGKVLGATVVSPVAGEIASELGLAIASGSSLYTIGNNMHAYPTFAFGLFQLGAEWTLGYLQELQSLRCVRRCCSRRLRGGHME